MKKIGMLLGALAVAGMLGLGGCSYGGVAASGNHAIVMKNDMLLMGLLRAAYVCKIDPAGLVGCSEGESP